MTKAPEGAVNAPATPGGPATPAEKRGRYGRVGRASGIYFAGALAAKAAKFLLVPFYVRFLTQAEVGTIVFLEAITFALARVLSLGLSNSVRRYYVEFEHEREGDRYVAGMWWVTLGITVLGGGLGVLTAPAWGGFISGQIPLTLLALAVVVAALQGNGTIAAQQYIAKQEPARHSAFTFAEFLLVTAVILYLVGGRGMGVEGVLWGQVIAYALWTVVVGVIVNRKAGWSLRFTHLGASFHYALWVMPHFLAMWGITFADRLILESYVSLDRLGIYGIGYQLGSLLTVFSLSVVNAWQAHFFRVADRPDSPAEFSRMLTRTALLVLWLSLAVFIFAPEIVAVVTTAAYAESAAILRIVAVAFFCFGLNQAFLLPLFYTKATKLASLSTVLGLAANLGMNLVLIPRMGIYGAAYATVGAYAVAALSAYVFARRRYAFSLDGRAVGTAVAVGGIVGGIGLLAFPEPTVWAWGGKAFLCLLFPLVLLQLPGRPTIAPADVHMIRSLFARLRKSLA